jgi:peptide/nickel transport system ATP-binding protein
MAASPLLEVRNLTVEFATRRGKVQAVKSIDISVGKGETVAIVGESGSGKSVTSYAVVRILDRAGRVAEGSIGFSGIDLVGASEAQMRDLRGREISMIFQNPRAALNPIRKVGKQIEGRAAPACPGDPGDGAREGHRGAGEGADRASAGAL